MSHKTKINKHFVAKSELVDSIIPAKKHQSYNSTRFDLPTKDNTYLDYTFNSHRSCISSVSEKDTQKKHTDSYVFDLVKTLELNFECIKMFLQESKMKKGDKKEIVTLFEGINQKFNDKKNLRNKIQDLRSKILISKQIWSQQQRKNEELFNFYTEKIEDGEEAVENKEEYRKIYEKKLKDIEKYIHRIITEKRKGYDKYKKYAKFKMSKFIVESTTLVKKKEELLKDIALYKENIFNLKLQNHGYQESCAALITQTNRNEMYTQRNKKYKDYIEKFKKQIGILEMRMKFFRNCFKDMELALKYFSITNKGKIAFY